MNLPEWVYQSFYSSIDSIYAVLPQAKPAIEKLAAVKIVSHRGEFDNKTVFENTLPAFDKIRDLGLWGIEFDIRWTKDLVPMVFHDKDAVRLFKSDLVLQECNFDEVRETLPQVPTLEEVIQRYGNNLHFFVELKSELYPESEKQSDILKNLFVQLQPVVDYHFISLDPAMFANIKFVPSAAFLPVAELNVRSLSRLAIDKNYGGLTGHYAVVCNKITAKHKAAQQNVGVGFVASKNSLYRELNRGVEWIFTNSAGKLKGIVDEINQGG